MSPQNVKSRRFAKLAKLADAGSDRRRRHLETARAELERLETQRRELGGHARRYEREGLERAREHGTDPLALRRRREFVACLVARVDALGDEIERAQTRVREARARHAAALARGQALETLRARAAADEALAAAREEQRRSDESWRARARATD